MIVQDKDNKKGYTDIFVTPEQAKAALDAAAAEKVRLEAQKRPLTAQIEDLNTKLAALNEQESAVTDKLTAAEDAITRNQAILDEFAADEGEDEDSDENAVKSQPGFGGGQ